jgi:hypothetical protein
MLNIVMLGVGIMISVFILTIIMQDVAKCCYAKCLYAKCLYGNCHMLSVIVLNLL